MSDVRTYTRGFNAGEITDEAFGLVDLPKYQNGAELMRNYKAKPHGPATMRTGTRLVRELKNSAKRAMLLPFTFSTTQTMVLEFGEGYVRFHTQGATLLYTDGAAWVTATAYTVGQIRKQGGVNYYCRQDHTSGTFATDLAAGKWYAMPTAPNIYEIPSSYLETDIYSGVFDVHYVQSSDVFTITHPNHKPRELRRYGATDWRLIDISFVSTLAAPAAPTVTPTGSGSTSYAYKVTSVSSDGKEESLPSPSGSTTNNLLTTGNYNTITWSAVSGIPYYNVYKQSNGLYGYIGQTDGTSFVDDNIEADLAKTPPIQSDPFNAAGKYPGAVSYFEQRRCFAGSVNEPQTLRMTRSGTEANMSYSIPARADDAISFRVAAREANTIRHIVPLQDLMLLTGAAEWRVTAVNSDAISGDSPPSVKPQSFVGANNAQPLIVNNNILFAAARGGHMRELAFNQDAGGYLTGDLSMFAPHLFDGMDIVQMAYQKSPYPIVWCVSSGGDLLGLTYVPEQKVGAWHHHDTEGGEAAFESVCVVAEGVEDAVYVIVRRTVGGVTKRFVERFAETLFGAQENGFFVDCGLTYSGPAVSSVTGLGHLEGKTVSILANGAVMPQQVVTGGAVPLENPSTLVHVGLPIEADLVPTPLVAQVDGAMAQGLTKNVDKIYLLVKESSGIFAGPSFDQLSEYKQRRNEPAGSPPALKTGLIELTLPPSWQETGRVCIRQPYPLPSTILGIAYNVTLGG